MTFRFERLAAGSSAVFDFWKNYIMTYIDLILTGVKRPHRIFAVFSDDCFYIHAHAHAHVHAQGTHSLTEVF